MTSNLQFGSSGKGWTRSPLPGVRCVGIGRFMRLPRNDELIETTLSHPHCEQSGSVSAQLNL